MTPKTAARLSCAGSIRPAPLRCHDSDGRIEGLPSSFGRFLSTRRAYAKWSVTIARGPIFAFSFSGSALAATCDITVTNDWVALHSALSDETYILASHEDMTFDVIADDVDHVEIRVPYLPFINILSAGWSTVTPDFWDLDVEVVDTSGSGLSNGDVERLTDGSLTNHFTPVFKIDLSAYEGEIAFGVRVEGAFHFTELAFQDFLPNTSAYHFLQGRCCGPNGCR